MVPHSLLLAWRRYLHHHVLPEARNIAAPVLAFLLEPISRLLDVATLTLWWGEECAATRESAGHPPLAEVWHPALWAMWKAQRFDLALAVVAIHLVDDLSNAKQETRTRSPTLELGGVATWIWGRTIISGYMGWSRDHQKILAQCIYTYVKTKNNSLISKL